MSRVHPIELLVKAYEMHTAGLAWSEVHHRLRPGLRDAVNRAKRYGLNR
jgi:hypothetical protein